MAHSACAAAVSPPSHTVRCVPIGSNSAKVHVNHQLKTSMSKPTRSKTLHPLQLVPHAMLNYENHEIL
eukprot:2840870-Pleurochrysis_carterae.AAC.2